MAQETEEIARARAIVLDANILLRAVLGPRVRTLIERYADTITLLTPQSCVDETREYLPELCIQRGWSIAAAIDLLDALLTSIVAARCGSRSRRRIASRDPDDWPAVAVSIALNAPIWTENGDFFGSGVATWTTINVGCTQDSDHCVRQWRPSI
jgi:predicted nucleic acid-binding protein